MQCCTSDCGSVLEVACNSMVGDALVESLSHDECKDNVMVEIMEWGSTSLCLFPQN